MKKLDEITALAIIFANTKRKKRYVDLLTLARCFIYLVKLYGSQDAVAEKVGLSTEMIREFLAVLKLPKEVQKMFHRRQIDSVDAAKELLSLKDPKEQALAAKTVADSLSKEIRDIKRLVKNTDVSVKKAKKLILDSKPKGLHIFVVDFDEDIYQAITRQSKAMKIRPPELVREIVKNWLRRKTTIHKERNLQ